MIIARWTCMRMAFALVGAPPGNDGGLYLPEWPSAKLNTGGFVDTIARVTDPFAWPCTITCNAQRTDATDGTSYWWYLSQRTDDNLAQVILVSTPDRTKSGTIRLELTDNVSRLLPGSTSADWIAEDGIRTIFKRASLYVQRQSDKAIQMVDMTNFILGVNV